VLTALVVLIVLEGLHVAVSVCLWREVKKTLRPYGQHGPVR
jgi:hypothetical protein